MSKMNGPTRKKLYKEMIVDEGEFCKNCNVLGKERQLVIDHKDNNNSNNHRENRQFLCRRCNYKKNPKRPVDECVSENEKSELQVNRTKEPQFRKFVAHEINERVRVPEHELINLGAEHIGMSPVTTKRYLDKMCSLFGIYQRTKSASTILVEYKNECMFR